MNLSGVSSAPALPALPALPAAGREASVDPTVAPRKPSPEAAAAAAAAAERQAAEKLPPLKPLSTTEMRMMLGAIPPGHAASRADAQVKGGSFDAYV